jgi:long-chain acyl-CoA synthetase
LTGGNGFVGKVLLALLLDRYPGFKKLHVLIRPKGNLSAKERFARDVLASPPLRDIAERLGESFLREKIAVWSGDASLPGCGLDPAVTEAWNRSLDLILNCAGLVEFFPPVDESLRANADTVDNLVAVARQTNAKVLHVSTCYVAGKADGLIEETEPILGFYPRREGPEDHSFDHAAEREHCRRRVAQIRESPSGAGGEDQFREVRQKLAEIGRQRSTQWGWVNTYTYSKSIGEQILASQTEVEYAIVRPAIVESALRFPFPGWIEGGRTAAPLILMAMGGLKDWPVRRDIPLEVVPVDLVAGAILAVGALLLNNEHEPVYQLGTADVNPFELEPLVRLLEDEASRTRNGDQGLRTPLWVDPLPRLRFLDASGARARRDKLQERISRAQGLLSSLQSSGVPGKASLARRSSALRTLELQLRFREQTIDQYLPFILENRYIFESRNIRQGYKRITPEDCKRIPWNPESIDWDSYWRKNQIEGVKRWVQPEAVREWAFRI